MATKKLQILDRLIVADSALSSSSTNPIQNKVVSDAISAIASLIEILDTHKVPTTRTINGKALSDNITLSAADVNAETKGMSQIVLDVAKLYTDDELKNYYTKEEVDALLDDGLMPGSASVANGSLLQVVDGVPTWVSIPKAEEATF